MGDLHNDTLEKLVSKIIIEIEEENQSTIAPLKALEQTLSKLNRPIEGL
jgi:hypothetical protein